MCSKEKGKGYILTCSQDWEYLFAQKVGWKRYLQVIAKMDVMIIEKYNFWRIHIHFFCGFCRPFFTSAFQTSCFRVFFGFIFVVFCISVVQVLLPCTALTFRKCHPHFIISCALRSYAATQCSNTAAEFVRLDLGQRGTAGKKKSDF